MISTLRSYSSKVSSPSRAQVLVGLGRAMIAAVAAVQTDRTPGIYAPEKFIVKSEAPSRATPRPMRVAPVSSVKKKFKCFHMGDGRLNFLNLEYPSCKMELSGPRPLSGARNNTIRSDWDPLSFCKLFYLGHGGKSKPRHGNALPSDGKMLHIRMKLHAIVLCVVDALPSLRIPSNPADQHMEAAHRVLLL